MRIKDICKCQAVLRNDIIRAHESGDYCRALSLIDVFAGFTTRINNILRDDAIEDVLISIASEQYDTVADIVKGEENTIVFYDQIGSTICLGEQYIRGLAANGYNIVYICENKFGIAEGLLNDVKQLCNSYYIFNSNELLKDGHFIGNEIRSIIIKSNPSLIICHSPAAGALGMSIMYSIKGARKYRIVPGDHHFYVGYDCFDFFIEFRPFGWSTAIYERGINQNKIYNLSYYPIIDEFHPFEGFPFDSKNKVVLATGGAQYKFQGSCLIADTIEYVLNNRKEAVFIYLGTPNKDILLLKQKYKWDDRLFFLGYRRDFVAIIKHIDILINSYPFSGGLICQTAAYFEKPILAYSDDYFLTEISVEHLLGDINEIGNITFSDKDKYFKEALRLIDTQEYRIERGKDIHSLLQTKDRFNEQLNSIIKGQMPPLNNQSVLYVDRTNRIKTYVDIQDSYKPECLSPLLRFFHFKSFAKFPFFWKTFIRHIKYSIEEIFASYTWVRRITHHNI